ncbi:DUF5658 family protein [Alkaliphilus metalliredigens]|nr:DUF5658 family protein [Alkaliphilus metalliredigens]
MFKEKKYKLLWVLLFGTGVFNVCDYFLTLKAIGMGYEEANPLVDGILHTPLFPITKLLIVPALLVLIWFLRKRVGKRVMLYAWTVFIAYFSLMIYFGGIFLS